MLFREKYLFENTFSRWCLIDINLKMTRPSQVTCSVTTVHVTCTETALHLHENSYTVLIENAIENCLLPAHTDHYALRK